MLNNISDIVTDNRIQRSDTFAANNENFAEILIIVTLAGLATVFFLIIIILLNNIKALRSSINAIKDSRSREVYRAFEKESEEQFLTTQKKNGRREMF